MPDHDPLAEALHDEDRPPLPAETVAYDRGFLDGAGYVQRRMDEAVAAERARITSMLMAMRWHCKMDYDRVLAIIGAGE